MLNAASLCIAIFACFFMAIINLVDGLQKHGDYMSYTKLARKSRTNKAIPAFMWTILMVFLGIACVIRFVNL